MRTKTYYLFALISLFIFSCNNDTFGEEILEDSKDFEFNSNHISVSDDILEIENKEILNSILKESSDEDFEKNIAKLNADGFKSLLPVFGDIDGPEVDQFLSAKQKSFETKGRLFTSKTSAEDLDIEDELIADNKFAGLLNSNRAIIVGGKFYIYTTNGLYFSKKKHRKYLKKYLKRLEKDKSFKITRKSDCPQQKSYDNKGKVSFTPIEGEVTSIDDKISLFTTKCGGGGGTPPPPTGGGGSSSSSIPLLKAQNLGVCIYDEDSLWEEIFGDTEKCIDYHDSTHRVQTKFWNQNYFIVSSLGASVKYQKKRFIGWSRSDTAEFVELGVNRLAYTYNDPITSFNPWDDRRVVVNYKGLAYDLSGKRVYSYPENSGAWPLQNQSETVAAIEVFIFGEDIYLPLSGKDANKSINTIINKINGWAIPKLKAEFATDQVRVDIVKFGQQGIDLVVIDRIKKRKSLASHPVDLNFLADWNSKDESLWKKLVSQLNSKKYTKVSIDMYGIAKRNGVIKGKRIVGAGK